MFFGFRVKHLIMDSLQNHDMSFLYVYLCSVHTYPDIFEARDYFLHFQTKFESFSPVHIKMLNNGSATPPFSGNA